VFLDDNPVERDSVREALPEVSVPELPGDPALYVRCLDGQGYFETTSFSLEDAQRSALYKEDTARIALKETVVDIDDYLRRLEMSASASEISVNTLARSSQLICKSNQFHLTTTRYTEADLVRMLDDPAHVCLSFRLKDRFGDSGLISVVIARMVGTALEIDTWVMSCRVLGRGMEEYIFQTIIGTAEAKGCDTVRGIYRETKKNQLVKTLYSRLGGVAVSSDDSQCETIYEFYVPTTRMPVHHIATHSEHQQ
jgi:FkbH-like protein